MDDRECREAFERGYDSGIKGDDPRECPYEKMTAEFKEWNRGHLTANQMVEFFTQQEAT